MTIEQIVASLGFKCEEADLTTVLEQLISEDLITHTRTQEYRIAD
jgi:hypothetical protein